MSQWYSAKLSDLVNITIGRTPSRGDLSLWDKEKSSDNAWLSIADLLNADGNIISDSREYITDKAARKFDPVPAGTLLVSFKLTLGRLAFSGRTLRTNEAIAALRNDESKICNEFLYHYLSFFDWKAYAAADQKLKGLTLNKAKLGEIIVKYPESIEMQKEMARLLDAAFEKIDKASESTEKNLQNARKLFTSELNNTFSRAGTIKNLGDVVTLQRGFDLPKQNRKAGEYRLVSSSGIIDTHDEFKVTGPGVYTGRSGSVGKTFYEEGNFWPLNTTLYVKDFHSNNPKYCFWLLKNFDLASFAGGTGVPTLNRNLVHVVKVRVHSIDEQRHVVSRIDRLYEQTQELQKLYRQKLDDLGALKQSLLKQAFLGNNVE